MKNILSKGAEANISLTDFDGEKVVSKFRVKKSYRLQQIDDELRKSRTKREAKLLSAARSSGIPVPRVFEIKEFELLMEFIDGPRVKNILTGENISVVCEKIGKYLGLMHKSKIVHGDVTTSNMIYKNGDVYFIDFGLGEISQSVELHGTDLYVLEEALKAAHFKIWEQCWKVIISAYEKSNPNAGAVLEQLEKIKLRARYMERIG